ncbi:uncharacterized protein V1478_003151, partial [Vespula squamosa]
ANEETEEKEKGTHKRRKKKGKKFDLHSTLLGPRPVWTASQGIFQSGTEIFCEWGDENKEKRESQSHSSIRKTRQAKLFHRSYGLVLSHDSNVYGTPPRKSLLLT